MEQKPVLQISYSLANIENAVHQLWQCGHQYKVWSLKGDMGAGKTTLVYELCKYLNVNDEVSSPTFSIINQYDFDKEGKPFKIYHMDWYRLEDEEEAVNAGVEDALLQPNSYAIVEWAEKAIGLMPKEYLQVEIEAVGDDERQLTVSVV